MLNFKIIKAIFAIIYYGYLLPKFSDTDPSYLISVAAQKMFTILNLKIKTDGKMETDEPVLLMCNHQTFFDGAVIKALNYDYVTVGKSDANKDYILSSVTKEMLNNLDSILYERGNKESGKKVRKLIASTILDRKKSVFLHPEGGAYADGKIHDFYKGSFEVAKHNSIKIQPITIRYDHDIAWGWNAKDIKNFDIKHNLKYLTSFDEHTAHVTFHSLINPDHYRTAEEVKKILSISYIKQVFGAFIFE